MIGHRRLVAAAIAALVVGAAHSTPTTAADPLDEVYEALTPAQRVGQLVIVPFDGPDAGPGSDIGDLVASGSVGGVIIDPRRGNFANGADAPSDVARLANALQVRSAAGAVGRVPLFVAVAPAVDGSVGTLLRGGMTPLPSPMAIGATWDPEHARRVGEIVGRELAAVGVNLFLGPSLDVLVEPRPSSSGEPGVRTFGGSPAWVGRFGQRFVEGVHLGAAGRVAVVPSAFPGVGGADRSPTDEVVVVERTLDDLATTDLVPFTAVAVPPVGQPATADGMSTSAVRFRGLQQQADRPFALDSRGLRYLAAQLAPLGRWLDGGGVIVSPGLGSTAVRRYVDPDLATFNVRRVVGEALAGGNDLLVLSRFGPPGDPEAGAENVRSALDWLTQRYGEDESVRHAIDRAARRMLALKFRLYGGPPAASAQVDAAAAIASVGLGREQVAAVAREALTVVSPSGAPAGAASVVSPAVGDRILFVVDARSEPVCTECTPHELPDPSLPVTIAWRDYGPDGAARVRQASDLAAVSYADLKGWLQARGLVAAEDTPVLVDPPGAERRDEVERLVRAADWIVFAGRDARPGAAPASDALRLFLAAAPPESSDARLVAVALGAPYYLDTTEIAKLSGYYAVYAHSEPFVEVMVRALFGDAAATGASPVSVPGAGYDLARRLDPDPAQAVALELVGRDAGAAVGEGADLVVRTTVVRDANGRPVPDGTRVTFQRYDQAEDVFLPDVDGGTTDGQATATVRADRGGELVITAAFENGLRSEALVVPIDAGGLGGMLLPDVALPDTLVRPRVPVDWGIFLLSLTLILLVGVVLSAVGPQARPPEHQARLFLLSLAWGLAGYLVVAAGGIHLGALPGGARLWPARWNTAYQAALLSLVLALVPVLPTLARSIRAIGSHQRGASPGRSGTRPGTGR